MTSDLRSNILTFYAGASAPVHAKTPKAAAKEKTEWAKLMDQLVQLQASAFTEPNASR